MRSAAGVPFDDERISSAELNSRRGGPGSFNDAVPLGQLPIVTIDGRVYTQSVHVARWAARQAKPGNVQLYPSDPLDQLVVDEVVGTLDEFWSLLPFSRQFPDAAELKAKREAWAGDVGVRYLKHIERRIRERGGPFVLGAEPSLADVWLLAFNLQLPNLDHVPRDLLAAYPLVHAAVAALRAHDIYAKFGEPA